MSKHFTAIDLFSVMCLAVVMTACGETARIEEKSTESVMVTRPARRYRKPQQQRQSAAQQLERIPV